MNWTSLLKRSVLIMQISLWISLSMSPMKAMAYEKMTWSSQPEVETKFRDSPYVLVPDMNYRNYKSLEFYQPEYEKRMAQGEECLYSESPLIWGILGAIVGGLLIGLATR